MERDHRIIPILPNNKASINYSMFSQFKGEQLYRFFCLSLFRDSFYNVRVIINDLSDVAGDSESTIKRFISLFTEFLEKKHYYQDNGFPWKTKRNIYHIPPMELECITLSKRLVFYELPSKVKGYLIKLIFIQHFTNTKLAEEEIITALHMDKDTVKGYNTLLEREGLLLIKEGLLVLQIDGILLDNDFSEQKRVSRSDQASTTLVNISWNTNNK